MREVVYVNSGEVEIGTAETVLRSPAIGSCVVVAAYDFKARIGAMAHIVLPGCAPQESLEKTKYAADAIEQMLNQMLEQGAMADDIEVCLVGAANVLQEEDDTICADNIKSVTAILAEKNIPVRASALGGTQRRSVSMDVESWTISHTQGDEKEKVLWKAVR